MSFVVLMAAISSISALSMDIMLPALPQIGQDFQVNNLGLQQIITLFIFGSFFGELILGAFSDAYGRKATILIGNSIFILGTCVCIFSTSHELLIFGRILQGMGAAGPKLAGRALLRDLYQGRQLASIFSLIYTLFIFVPMVAPLIGQGLSTLSNWHAIFVFLLVFTTITSLWFWFAQAETLAPNKRIPIHFRSILRSISLILWHPKVLGYTIVGGLIFGMKLTYLSNAQQIFDQIYNIQSFFPLIFAGLASSICCAFYLNSHLVEQFGMHKICWVGLMALIMLTSIYAFICLVTQGVPHLAITLIFFYCAFFCFGTLWGNIGALTMEYLGNVAGIGSTVMSAGSALVSFTVASIIGFFYATSMTSLAVGFMLTALLGGIIFYKTQINANESLVLSPANR